MSGIVSGLTTELASWKSGSVQFVFILTGRTEIIFISIMCKLSDCVTLCCDIKSNLNSYNFLGNIHYL